MRVEVVDAALSFGGRIVFEGLSAVFEAGGVTALVGPSGSGKSSLLAVMAGYQPLDSGRVELSRDDGPPAAPSPSFVAWVPQGSNALGRRTVLDNVLISPLGAGFSMADATERAVDALSTVGLGGKLAQQARRLSGGELQRLAIARALASDKDLVFADEPSANLDAANTEAIAEIFTSLAVRASIIVATHDPVLIEAAGRAVHIRESVHAG